MRIEEANREVIGLLRTYLTHPDGTTPGEKWIYIGYPRIGEVVSGKVKHAAKFPRVSVTQTGNLIREAGVGERSSDGTLGFWNDVTYDIDIWVKKGNIYDISGTKRAGTSLRDYIGDEIVKIFKIHRDEFVDIKIIGDTSVPYMDLYELFRKTITIQITFFREKSE